MHAKRHASFWKETVVFGVERGRRMVEVRGSKVEAQRRGVRERWRGVVVLVVRVVVRVVKMASICWIMHSRVEGWESWYFVGVGSGASGSSGDRGRLRENGDLVIPSCEDCESCSMIVSLMYGEDT